MPVAGCGAEEGGNLGQESALARALPARVPPKLRGCRTSLATRQVRTLPALATGPV